MSKWEEKRLEDIIDVNPPVKLKKGESYPFIDIDKVSPTRRSVTNEDVQIYDGQSSSKFCDSDTVFSRITPCLENRKIAKVAIEGDAAFGSTEFYVFRAKKKKADARFTYYLTSSDAVVLPAINSMTGASGRQRADKRFIQRLKLNLPDLPTQERIADILSAYDDLIEANNHRIELLEQTAQELYKEWFVRFRFPGYEAAKFENGLPSEWERKRLGDMIAFNPTITTKGATGFRSIPMAALSTNNMVIDESLITSTDTLSGSRSQNLDTLLARITPCLENGKTGFVFGLKEHEVAGGSTEFIVMRSKSLTPYFVYFLARSDTFREYAISSMNGADGRQRAKVDRLEKLWWLQPPQNQLEQFDRKVKGSFELIHALTHQNQNLDAQRDMLLPRLMSGKLEV